MRINNKLLEEIYNKHIKKLFGFFFIKTSKREIAEDLTSETFLAFAEAMKGQKDVDNPEGFLYGIARNVFRNYLTKKYKTETLIDNFDENFYVYVEETVETRSKKKNTMEKIAQKYIDLLPKKQKIVLELRLIKKYSLKEISVKLKKNMGYVKVTQTRGIKNLRKLIATTT